MEGSRTRDVKDPARWHRKNPASVQCPVPQKERKRIANVIK